MDEEQLRRLIETKFVQYSAQTSARNDVGKTMKRRAAHRCWSSEDGADYTLIIDGNNEAELTWQWGDKDNGGGGELTMSVADLK
jgi:hypothetical protein